MRPMRRLLAAMVLLGASGPAAAPEPRYVTFLRAPGPWGPLTRAQPLGTQCPDDGCVNEWVPSSCTEHTFRSVLTTLRLNGTENAAMRPAVKYVQLLPFRLLPKPSNRSCAGSSSMSSTSRRACCSPACASASR